MCLCVWMVALRHGFRIRANGSIKFGISAFGVRGSVCLSGACGAGHFAIFERVPGGLDDREGSQKIAKNRGYMMVK